MITHYLNSLLCGNCAKAQEHHMPDGSCLFEPTQYRSETLTDHIDCECEEVIDLAEGKNERPKGWIPIKTTPAR